MLTFKEEYLFGFWQRQKKFSHWSLNINVDLGNWIQQMHKINIFNTEPLRNRTNIVLLNYIGKSLYKGTQTPMLARSSTFHETSSLPSSPAVSNIPLEKVIQRIGDLYSQWNF